MRQTIFESPALVSLKQSLDTTSLQQRVIAHNVANAETEGFVPRRVEFQRELSAAMKLPTVALSRSNPAHQLPVNSRPGVPPVRVVEMPGAGIEDFMVDLVENTYLYQASARLLAGQYGSLHQSIRGRSA